MGNSRIIIAASTEKELTGLTDQMNTPVVIRTGGRKVKNGTIEGKPVQTVVTGLGLVNAVQALTAVIEKEKPSLMIMTGTAGAFTESGLQVGEIGIAIEEIDVHLGLEPADGEGPLSELPFYVVRHGKQGLKNRYPLYGKWANLALDIIKKDLEGSNIGVRQGPFVTVSTITATTRRATDLWEQFQPCMESMEGSGAAHLAIHYAVPFVEIRSASNLVGPRDRESWNFSLACERAGSAVLAFIRGLDIN